MFCSNHECVETSSPPTWVNWKKSLIVIKGNPNQISSANNTPRTILNFFKHVLGFLKQWFGPGHLQRPLRAERIIGYRSGRVQCGHHKDPSSFFTCHSKFQRSKIIPALWIMTVLSWQNNNFYNNHKPQNRPQLTQHLSLIWTYWIASMGLNQNL